MAHEQTDKRVEDLPFRIEQLPGSRKLAVMARAAKSPGRPQSAMAVCREVLKRLSPRQDPAKADRTGKEFPEKKFCTLEPLNGKNINPAKWDRMTPFLGCSALNVPPFMSKTG